MAIVMTVTGVKPLGNDIWALKMAPHEVRHFGQTAQASGTRSVLLLESCEFNARTGELRFPLDAAVPLNVGTSDSAVALLAKGVGDYLAREERPASSAAGPGDRSFLTLARAELSAEMAATAEKLLAGVRARSPGDLKRGKSRNFSDTPDNFWYVILQPRIDEISITVRGSVSHFRGVAKLEIKDDRGNTRFKVRGDADIDDALKLIFHAIRRA